LQRCGAILWQPGQPRSPALIYRRRCFSPSGIIPDIANIATWQYTATHADYVRGVEGDPTNCTRRPAWTGASGCDRLENSHSAHRPAIILTFIFSIIGI
jgi:hypothetical protein